MSKEKKVSGTPTFHVRDRVSALTHFIGLLAAVLLCPPLLVQASARGADTAAMASLGVFMLSMIALYAASTAYHSFCLSPEGVWRLKKLDHMMIFVLIAGTYTPVCVIVLPEQTGRWMLALIWGLALVGMVLKFFWVGCPRWFSSVIYIAMGWTCLLAMPQIVRSLSTAGFVWLLLGGIAYTAGGVIYALKPRLTAKLKNFGPHEIFHLFVMAGSLCHYLTMLGLRY